MDENTWTKLCNCTTSGNCPEFRNTPDGGVEIRDLDQHDKVTVLTKDQIEIFVIRMSLSK